MINNISTKLLEAKNEPLWYFNKNSLIIIGVIVLGLLLFPFTSPSKFAIHLMMMIFMHAVMAQSWNVLAGFSGQISLGHAIFFGIGAYASAYFYVKLHITPWIGILAGIYLSEYGDRSKIANVTRLVTDVMLSAPSIVIGLFVYAIYVSKVKHFSGFAGTIALSLLAVPVIVKTTENILRLVPNTLREAAYALGAPKWKVSITVILRAAKSGVITGILLAVARVSGETAPLLFTALNNQFFSTDMNRPISTLPVVIYQFAMSPYLNWVNLAWGGALIITLTVLGLNILARVFFRENK